MLFALERPDGSIGVMTIMPVRVEDAAGKRYEVMTISGDDNGVTIIIATKEGEQQKLVWTGALRQLAADSISDFTLIFPTIEEEVAKHNLERYVGHHRITAVPKDRTYRNAWAMRDGKVEHDMAKARELHRGMMREARAPLLAALDIAYQRADEAEDVGAKRVIAARKKALRDITQLPEIEAANTIEELKLIWPLGAVGAP